jgi:hypothetical protein
MPRSSKRCPEEFRQQMIDLVLLRYDRKLGNGRLK